MAALNAASLNGVKIYNLASGKTLPQWMAEKNKKALSKDEDYRRRVELVQDFHFPSGSQCIKMSGDGNYIVATGMYPPMVKVYDVRDLSMKFERRLDAEVLQLEILSQDYGKLVFLQTDRSLSFHAPYGAHYNLRLPKFGRDMCYQRETCDLFVGASSSQVYRVNLDQGRFLAPLETNGSGANVVALNPLHQLLGIGLDSGVLECWDTRCTIKKVGVLDSTIYGEITALNFHDDGLTFGIGRSSGLCQLFDLRSSKPLLQKQHQYNLPIRDLQFHESRGLVISSDAKVVKLWNQENGKIFTNVEASAEVRNVCIVPQTASRHNHSDKASAIVPKSGVLLIAGEQERIMSYYIPELGHAPRWCSFLDSLTEELEETATSTVYDDYQFVTREQLSVLALDHLKGTPLLKPYMHGFFMDARLYKKVQAVAQPMAYAEYKKNKLKEKMEEKQANRITIKKRLPQVNRATAERMLADAHKKKGKNRKNADQRDNYSNPLEDDRFAKMFTSKDFEVDESSETYQLLHPNAQNTKKKVDIDVDSQGEESDDESVPEVDRFAFVDDKENDDKSEIEGKPSDESSSDESENMNSLSQSKQYRSVMPRPDITNIKKIFEITTGEKISNLLEFGSLNDTVMQKQRKQMSKVPLQERIQMNKRIEKERSSYRKEETEDGGYVREMQFIPKKELEEHQRNLELERHETLSGPENNHQRKKRGISDLMLSAPSRNPRFRR